MRTFQDYTDFNYIIKQNSNEYIIYQQEIDFNGVFQKEIVYSINKLKYKWSIENNTLFLQNLKNENVLCIYTDNLLNNIYNSLSLFLDKL